MNTMTATKVKTIDTLQWIRRFIAQQHKVSPHIEVIMTIWIDPKQGPLDLKKDLELVSICGGPAIDPEPEFRAVRFARSSDKPRLILTLTNRGELSLDFEQKGKRSYFSKLKSKLESGQAVIAYPNSNRDPAAMFQELLLLTEVSN